MALHLCMKFKILVTFLIILSISLSSCDRPQCTNENLVFKTNEPNSKEYKDELVAQLNKVDRSKLNYWLKNMKIKMMNKPYISLSKEMVCVPLFI